MTILMSDVNASLEYYKKEREVQVKKLIEQILSESDLSFAKIENINAILKMPDEEFNIRLLNLERGKVKGNLLWNPKECWLTIHRRKIKQIKK